MPPQGSFRRDNGRLVRAPRKGGRTLREAKSAPKSKLNLGQTELFTVSFHALRFSRLAERPGRPVTTGLSRFHRRGGFAVIAVKDFAEGPMARPCHTRIGPNLPRRERGGLQCDTAASRSPETQNHFVSKPDRTTDITQNPARVLDVH